MFDSIIVAVITVLAGFVVYYHMKKQIGKGSTGGKCTDCPLHHHKEISHYGR